MSWILKEMIWNRMLIFALLTTGITGSVFYLAMRILTYILKIRNPHILLFWQKAALYLYMFPIVACSVFLKRADLFAGDSGIAGVFWTNRQPFDDIVCGAVALLWFAGFFTAFARTRRRKQMLDKVWQKNEPVEDSGCLEIFEEYKRRFGFPHIRLYQNPLVLSPVAARRRHFMIVLPEQAYTEKELCMIFTHEMNHVRHGDLFWRKAAMFVGWLNWYLPFVGALQKELVYQQEIICDLRSGIGNPAFTQREYGQFLVSMTDNGWDKAPTTALCESKNMMIGRLEMMAQAKKMKKVKWWLEAAACTGLAVVTMIPSGIVSAQVIAWEEQRIYDSEIAVEVPMQDMENTHEEHTEYADMTVTEIDLTDGIDGHANTTNIDREIAANTRVLFASRTMSAKSTITISTACDDESAVYRIGIKYNNSGKMTYIEGSGRLMHTFTIATAGSYAAYVENRSSQSITVMGYADYD